MKSSFEEFTQNVMHPLESSALPGSASARVPTRIQPELEPLPTPLPRGPPGSRGGHFNLPRLPGGSGEGVESNSRLHRRSHSPRSHLLLPAGNSTSPGWYSPYPRRSRANTNEDRRPLFSKSGEFAPNTITRSRHLGRDKCPSG